MTKLLELKISNQVLLFIIILGSFLTYVLLEYTAQIPSGDEIVFVRVTQNLPNYYVHKEWFTLSGKDNIKDVSDASQKTTDFINTWFEVPYWSQPQLDSYLTYPFVKVLYSDKNITSIKEGIERLRTLAWIMLVGSIVLILIMLFKKGKRKDLLFFTLLPLLSTIPYFTKWNGDNWFYYDSFVLLFLCIALVIRKTKYERFIYIPLVLMAGSKWTAILYLIPFIIENRKTALCILGLSPHLIGGWIVTGDPLYVLKTWNDIGTGIGIIDIWSRIDLVVKNLRMSMWLPVVIILPFGYLIYQAIKKRTEWFYPVLYGCITIGALGWAEAHYHYLIAAVIGMVIIYKAVELIYDKNNNRKVLVE